MSKTATMDPVRTRLRATVAEIDAQIRKLEGGADRTALTKAWDDLVGQLALGPEPKVRACPNCGSLGFRMATICSGCWTKLTPPEDDD